MCDLHPAAALVLTALVPASCRPSLSEDREAWCRDGRNRAGVLGGGS